MCKRHHTLGSTKVQVGTFSVSLSPKQIPYFMYSAVTKSLFDMRKKNSLGYINPFRASLLFCFKITPETTLSAHYPLCSNIINKCTGFFTGLFISTNRKRSTSVFQHQRRNSRQ